MNQTDLRGKLDSISTHSVEPSFAGSGIRELGKVVSGDDDPEVSALLDQLLFILEEHQFAAALL